jgi:thiamine-monophosphate kinase
MSNARKGEFELIATLFAPLAAPAALHLRDDAAFLKVSPGHELVVTMDTVIAGVHFRLDDPPELIARKALRVNLSDLAAKGAKPIGFLHALALNDTITDAYLEKYASGLAADVAAYQCPLFGGDTTSGPGLLAITITAMGEVESGKGILRSGAKPGDILFVTGTIGDGALGLACLTGGLPPSEALIDRYRLPQPRLGLRLNDIASASLDVSDGLVADVGHICTSSGVGAVIERAKIPLSRDAKAAVATDKMWWDRILTGGDDYELAFTVPPARVSRLAELAGDVTITEIGRVVAGNGVQVVDESGAPLPISAAGYRHR